MPMPPVLTSEQRRMLREAVKKRHALQREILVIDSQIEEFVDRKAELREQMRALSNAELARLLGVSTSAVHYVVNGRI